MAPISNDPKTATIMMYPDIMHESVTEWKRKAPTLKSGPGYVTVSSSGRCNLTCFMCGYSIFGEMPIGIDAKRLEPFLQKAFIVIMAGGEPLWLSQKANPVSREIFEMLKNGPRRVRMGATTNGIFFNKDIAELAMERFESVHFSVDTTDPALYEKIRGKPMLDTILKNIEYLARLKKEAGRKLRDAPHIAINTIVMKSTFDGLPAVARILAEFGGISHSLITLSPKISPDFESAINERHGKDGAKKISDYEKAVTEELFCPEGMDKQRLENVRKELKEIYSANGIYVQDQVPIFADEDNAKPLPLKGKEVCPEPWIRAHIQENGDLTCCCSNSEVLGNVGHQEYEEIWNGDKAQELREAFIAGEMKGCMRSTCPAMVDYFKTTEKTHSPKMLKNLHATLNGLDVKKILVLGAATLYQSHLAVRTLMRRFPDATLTVVRSEASDNSTWEIDATLLLYPERLFNSDSFNEWWHGINASATYELTAAIYNNDDRKGYSEIEKIVRSQSSGLKIGLKPSGEVIKL